MSYAESVVAIVYISDSIPDLRIVSAAHEGKVDTLFVEVTAQLYFRYDPEISDVEFLSDSSPTNDLLQRTVVLTFACGRVV
jgi:hypothetical protein